MCIIKLVVSWFVCRCSWVRERGHVALIYQRSFGVKQFDLLGLLGGGVVSSVSHHFLPSSILQGNARWPPDENLESLSQWRELTTKFHVKHAMITGQHKVKRSYWKVMGIGEMSFYDDNNRLESSLSSLKLSKKERGQRWVRFYDYSYRRQEGCDIHPNENFP